MFGCGVARERKGLGYIPIKPTRRALLLYFFPFVCASFPFLLFDSLEMSEVSKFVEFDAGIQTVNIPI